MIALLQSFFSHPMTLISIGGIVGCNARYAISVWASHLSHQHTGLRDWFYATIAINIVGSLLLGILAASITQRQHWLYLLLGVGFCGGFTTFSTFSLEAIQLVEQQRYAAAFAYVGSSVAGGLIGFATAYGCIKYVS